jgi:hypothetical protein
MQKNLRLARITFWLTAVLAAAMVALIIITFYGDLPFIYYQFAPISNHHLFSITGAAFILLYTPAYYVTKRRYSKSYYPLLTVHVLGNMVAAVLISIHFGEHISEFAGVALHPATGVPLFVALLALVVTGIIMRFTRPGALTRRLRFWHQSFAVSFGLIVIFHMLYGFGVFD